MPATKLTPERIIAGAVRLADRIGADALTIRKIAEEIDVKPMTIYHHVANKEAIIDGMVDAVFAEIDLPPTDVEWRTAMTQRCRRLLSIAAGISAARWVDQDTFHIVSRMGGVRSA